MTTPAGSALPSSTLRLPTVSASDILRDIQSSDANSNAILSTASSKIDSLLQGGFERGKTTEIWGPTGAGKSAIALTTATRVISEENAVIWAACSSPISSDRLKRSLPSDSLRYFYSTRPSSLSHLLGFILHSNDNPVLARATLLIIDDLNTLVDLDYPRQSTFVTSADNEARKWQAGRRSMILATIASALNRMANLHGICVIVTSGCATSTRSGTGCGPLLVPALGGNEWDAGIWSRLAVFQDFNGRFVALQKSRGVVIRSTSNPVVHFELSQRGLLLDRSMPQTSSSPVLQTIMSSNQTKKRAYEEIADSEDEDEYGWQDMYEADVLSSQQVEAQVDMQTGMQQNTD